MARRSQDLRGWISVKRSLRKIEMTDCFDSTSRPVPDEYSIDDELLEDGYREVVS